MIVELCWHISAIMYQKQDLHFAANSEPHATCLAKCALDFDLRTYRTAVVFLNPRFSGTHKNTTQTHPRSLFIKKMLVRGFIFLTVIMTVKVAFLDPAFRSRS